MRSISIGLLVLALMATSCSSGETGDTQPETTATAATVTSSTSTTSSTTTTSSPSAFPVTVDAPNGPVVLEAMPTRIVSISPTATEVLFAIGAGEQVVAVDSLSNHPDAAPITDLSAFTPSVESIATYAPDLVVLSYDPGDVVAGLEAVGIPAIVHTTAASLSDAYGQWEQLGAATGHLAEAAGLVASVESDIAGALAQLPASAADLTYYYELDPELYSATSDSFIGELFAGTTMANIADSEDVDGYGYPQLSAEYVVASDPDVILLADTKCCGQTAITIAERPGWDTLSAVARGSIVELDDDIASRWGPRIVVLVEDVVAAIVALTSVDA
jgi:cobalamin transport system substrate-binding protein